MHEVTINSNMFDGAIVVVAPSCAGKTTWMNRVHLDPKLDMDAHLESTLTPNELFKVSAPTWTSEIGDVMKRGMSRSLLWRVGTVVPTWADFILYVQPWDEVLGQRARQRGQDPLDCLAMAAWLDEQVVMAEKPLVRLEEFPDLWPKKLSPFQV